MFLSNKSIIPALLLFTAGMALPMPHQDVSSVAVLQRDFAPDDIIDLVKRKVPPSGDTTMTGGKNAPLPGSSDGGSPPPGSGGGAGGAEEPGPEGLGPTQPGSGGKAKGAKDPGPERKRTGLARTRLPTDGSGPRSGRKKPLPAGEVTPPPAGEGTPSSAGGKGKPKPRPTSTQAQTNGGPGSIPPGRRTKGTGSSPS